MTLLLVLPVLLPLLTGCLCLLAGQRITQRRLALGGAAALLASAVALLAAVQRNGIQAVQLGGWPAPFGITLVADLFSAYMVVLAGLMTFAVTIYSFGSMDAARERFGYYPLLQIMVMGVCGSFLTGDIFNLYVWFEVMLVASFVLLALGGERSQIEGAIKYVTLNLISSIVFLTGVGILYGIAGSLNMADLSRQLPNVPSQGLVTTVGLLFLIAFGIKAAAFPLFFWLPASYHTPPVVITAIFAGLLTKVGVYALIRVFTLLFTQETAYTHTIILVIAGFTMVTGVLGAVAQMEVRRLLSFHIVSQIGYLLMGLGLYSVAGLAGSVYFMGHVIMSKSALFLVSGVTYQLSGTYQLKKLGGFYHTHPGLSIMFLVPALSLAGIPPLSGFFAKLALVRAGLGGEQFAIVTVALAVSILTMFSMIKIWTEAFWKPAPNPSHGPTADPPQSLLLPIALLAGLIVAMGLAAEPVFSLALRAAEQLMDPAEYVRAVREAAP